MDQVQEYFEGNVGKPSHCMHFRNYWFIRPNICDIKQLSSAIQSLDADLNFNSNTTRCRNKAPIVEHTTKENNILSRPKSPPSRMITKILIALIHSLFLVTYKVEGTEDYSNTMQGNRYLNNGNNNAHQKNFNSEISLPPSLEPTSIPTLIPTIEYFPPQKNICSLSYTGILGLTISYSLESSADTTDTEVSRLIHALERVVLDDLSKEFLPCDYRGDDVRRRTSRITNVELRKNLGIVGIDASPVDEVSELSSCNGKKHMNNRCTVVHGFLTLFLSSEAKLDRVRYASRSTIKQSMEDGTYKSKVPGTIHLEYLGPNFDAQESIGDSNNNSDMGDEVGDIKNQPDSSESQTVGLSDKPSNFVTSKVILVAAGASVMVCVVGVLILSKAFGPRRKMNCLSYCDSSGIDRSYDCRMAGEEHGRGSNTKITSNRVTANDIQWTINHDLSVILEASDEQSSTTGGHTNSPSIIVSSVGGWTDDDLSVYSSRSILSNNSFNSDKASRLGARRSDFFGI